MSYLLHLDATSFDAESISRQVARSFRQVWTGEVVHRDLAATPVPHLTAAGITARITDPAGHTPGQRAALAVQTELIDEFLGAGGYLFTVPLYNWGVPSSFKAWLDQIVVVGRTIALPDGPAAAGRPAIVISSRGGAYMPGTPMHGRDHLVPHLQEILGTELGLDLQFITPSFGLAPVVDQMAHLLDHHRASLSDSHDQARKLAESFTLHTTRAA